MLVVIGATPEGRKELVGFQVGTRESAQSWRELLVGLKARGLAMAPELAIGDGALGFWKALEEVFPATRHQRCWVHKAVNVLNKLPKSLQANARQDLREIWLAPDRATAEAALATEHARSERLLTNVLPVPVAERLKAGEEPIADDVPAASVLFADIVDFTPYAAGLDAREVVEERRVAGELRGGASNDVIT